MFFWDDDGDDDDDYDESDESDESDDESLSLLLPCLFWSYAFDWRSRFPKSEKEDVDAKLTEWDTYS